MPAYQSVRISQCRTIRLTVKLKQQIALPDNLAIAHMESGKGARIGRVDVKKASAGHDLAGDGLAAGVVAKTEKKHDGDRQGQGEHNQQPSRQRCRDDDGTQPLPTAGIHDFLSKQRS